MIMALQITLEKMTKPKLYVLNINIHLQIILCNYIFQIINISLENIQNRLHIYIYIFQDVLFNQYL